jgi:hypothetical protein
MSEALHTRLYELQKQLDQIASITPTVTYKIDENRQLAVSLTPGFTASINVAVRAHLISEIEMVQAQLGAETA